MATTFERYGHYWVLTVHSDEIALTCRGRPEQKQIVETGLYLILLHSTCTLTGHDWSLKEVMVQPNISITTNLNIQLDNDWLQDIIGEQFDDEPLDPALEYKLIDNDDDIQDINDIINEIDQIKDNHDNLNDDVFVHSTINWSQIGIITIIITIMIVISCLVYSRRNQIRYFLGRPKKIKTKKVDDLELEENKLEDIIE